MGPELIQAVTTAIDAHPHEVKNYREGKANVTYLAGWAVSMLRSRDPNCRVTVEDAREAVETALRNGGKSCLI